MKKYFAILCLIASCTLAYSQDNLVVKEFDIGLENKPLIIRDTDNIDYLQNTVLQNLMGMNNSWYNGNAQVLRNFFNFLSSKKINSITFMVEEPDNKHSWKYYNVSFNNIKIYERTNGKISHFNLKIKNKDYELEYKFGGVPELLTANQAKDFCKSTNKQDLLVIDNTNNEINCIVHLKFPFLW